MNDTKYFTVDCNLRTGKRQINKTKQMYVHMGSDR